MRPFRRCRVLLFLLLTGISAGALKAAVCGAKPADGSPAQLAYAQCSLANSNWAEAEEQIRNYRSRHPESLDAALAKADLLIETHRLEDAEQLLGPLTREYPKSVPVLTLYAELSEKLGRWGEAEPYLRKAAELTPNDPEVWKRLADLYSANQPEDAVRCLQKAIALSPRDPVALAGLASALQRTEQPAQAKATFAQAMEINRKATPPSAIADYLYGQYLADAQEFKASVRQYDLAIQEDPELSDAYFARAQALLELRDWAGAKRDLQRTVKLPGHELPSLSMMVHACRELGEAAEAQQWSQRLAAASEQRDDQRVAGNLIAGQMQNASALMEQKKYDEAAVVYKRLVDSHPEAGHAWQELGLCYMFLGKPVEAEGAFRQVVALDSSSSRGHVLLGQSLLRQGREADARTEFASALKIEPMDVEAGLGLAASYIVDKQYAPAIRQLRALQPRDAASPEISLMLAESLYKSGQRDAAVREVNKLLTYDPENKAGREMLAAITK
jgi:tetratricopeptide (TPR) repeat protein